MSPEHSLLHPSATQATGAAFPWPWAAGLDRASAHAIIEVQYSRFSPPPRALGTCAWRRETGTSAKQVEMCSNRCERGRLWWSPERADRCSPFPMRRTELKHVPFRPVFSPFPGLPPGRAARPSRVRSRRVFAAGGRPRRGGEQPPCALPPFHRSAPVPHRVRQCVRVARGAHAGGQTPLEAHLRARCFSHAPRLALLEPHTDCRRSPVLLRRGAAPPLDVATGARRSYRRSVFFF